MIMHCPYCEIKNMANIKTVFEALQPHKGNCPDCGAYIDEGQYKVKVNSYADIYKGCLELIDGLVEEFNRILADCDCDPGIELGFEDDYELQIYTTDIIDRLFLPYYGGTTKRNFARALGIEDHEHTWVLKPDEVDE